MAWEPGPVVTRRRLGGELKRLRVTAGLLLEDVAEKLECSPSKISRLENGKGIPKNRDVRDMLDVYGIGRGELREQLLEWSQTGQARMWWSAYADILPSGFDTYVELEWDATRITAYESHIVHGLLQTPAYARAILESSWEAYGKLQIDRLVEIRLKRQVALLAEHGLTFCCILDESALYREVASPQVLRAQLEQLLDRSTAKNVEMRILPFSAGLVTPGLTSFSRLEFENLPEGVVHLERPESATFLEDLDEVARHKALFEKISSAALSEEASVRVITAAVRRLSDAE